jgi:large subunit ribosomal protein L35
MRVESLDAPEGAVAQSRPWDVRFWGLSCRKRGIEAERRSLSAFSQILRTTVLTNTCKRGKIAALRISIIFEGLSEMPKQKSHKGLSKRVKVTATGKIKRKRSFGGHLMSGKNGKRRRHVSSSTIMGGASARAVRVRLCK